MRILILVSTLQQVSGWGTYGRNTVHGLRSRGHTVRALVHLPSGEENERAVLPEPHHLVGSPWLWIKTAWAVRKEIQEFQPDVVHVLVEPYALVMPIISMMTGKMPPWVLSLNGTYSILPLTMLRTRRLFSNAYRSAGKILIPSKYTGMRALAALAQWRGEEASAVVREKMTLFRLGIEDMHQRERRLDPHCKHILYVGGIKPRKGIAEVIAACAELRALSDVPFHLHLVGTLSKDRYAEQVQSQVAEQNLRDAVTFHGHIERETLEQLYDKTDLFIMLSKSHGHHFEGFGLVFLEANIRGIPTIGPSDSGCAEAIEDGVSGYVVNHDDPKDTSKRMHQILAEGAIDPEKCRAWARLHSVDQQVASFEKAYLDVRAVKTA